MFIFSIFISLVSKSTMIMLIVEVIILTTMLLPRFIYNAGAATRLSPWLSGRKRLTSILMITLQFLINLTFDVDCFIDQQWNHDSHRCERQGRTGGLQWSALPVKEIV